MDDSPISYADGTDQGLCIDYFQGVCSCSSKFQFYHQLSVTLGHILILSAIAVDKVFDRQLSSGRTITYSQRRDPISQRRRPMMKRNESPAATARWDDPELMRKFDAWSKFAVLLPTSMIFTARMREK